MKILHFTNIITVSYQRYVKSFFFNQELNESILTYARYKHCICLIIYLYKSVFLVDPQKIADIFGSSIMQYYAACIIIPVDACK